MMSIDKDKITTQDELNEPAPIDQADARVAREMKELEEKARRSVREGLDEQIIDDDDNESEKN
jgi:hypothetical protein